jgi:hypothetical protein
MSDTNLVVVRTFADRIEAELAQSALKASGIESMIRADDAGGMRPAMGFSNGVALLVRVEQATAADEVLSADQTRGQP